MAKPGGTRALQALETSGVSYSVHAYELDDMATGGSGAASYGQRVAAAVGTEPERLYKTLVATLTGGAKDESVVAVVPVAGQLGLKQLARAAGAKKAEMADPALAERLTGYVTGGISPFGQLRKMRCFVDETVELWDTVVVSAGRRGLQVELPPADLLHLTEAVLADLSV